MRARNATAAKKAQAVALYFEQGSVVAGSQVGVDRSTVLRWVRQFEAGTTFDGVGEVGSQAWRDDAACAGAPVEWFFVEPGNRSREAKALCASCPVRLECLEYALVGRESDGVWGGMTYKERLEFRRTRESRVA